MGETLKLGMLIEKLLCCLTGIISSNCVVLERFFDVCTEQSTTF